MSLRALIGRLLREHPEPTPVQDACRYFGLPDPQRDPPPMPPVKPPRADVANARDELEPVTPMNVQHPCG